MLRKTLVIAALFATVAGSAMAEPWHHHHHHHCGWRHHHRVCW
jgi:Spy/CpxP family protein refolding chaperone